VRQVFTATAFFFVASRSDDNAAIDDEPVRAAVPRIATVRLSTNLLIVAHGMRTRDRYTSPLLLVLRDRMPSSNVRPQSTEEAIHETYETFA
jgi:hypothetical protein